jgi:hypothetical protein
LEYGVQKKWLLQPGKLQLWNMVFRRNGCCNQENFSFGIWCSEEMAVATKKTSALEYGVKKKWLLQPSKLLVQENLCSGI